MNMPFFISGDWPFFFDEMLSAVSWLPTVYRAQDAFGVNAATRLWVDYPFHLVTKALWAIGFPWVGIEKLWLLGILLLAGTSMYTLASRYFAATWLRVCAVLVYCFNSYFYLLLGGGQLGVALAYAFFPYVLARWFALLDNPKGRGVIGSGLAIGILFAFDLRLGYLFSLVCFLYGLVHPWKVKAAFWSVIKSAAVAASIHLYWILPIVWSGSVSLPREATGAGSLSFFSVADFSHAVSLLHPNWPENLFGRVYFQKPEFMLLPILAFAALLRKTGRMEFFGALALLGAFLAKGTSEPFGDVYRQLFTLVPGFILFRDPTKFYLFIALSYALLIPSALEACGQWRKVKPGWILSGFVIFLLLLHSDIYSGKTTHSFQFKTLPTEYRKLKDALVADGRFSRVLWIPVKSHFTFATSLHPALDAERSFGVSSPSAIAAILMSPTAEDKMREMGVGYVVVPQDEKSTVFLRDYVYDDALRQMLLGALDQSQLVRDPAYTHIAVYTIDSHKDLFGTGDDQRMEWSSAGDNTYRVVVPKDTGAITMRMAYDGGWRLKAGMRYERPVENVDGWMQFDVSQIEGPVSIYFEPDRLAMVGAWISGLMIAVYGAIILRRRSA